MIENTLSCAMRISCCDIPTVYSNKQSYYECLCYLDYKINECINAINGFSDEYKKYTDTEIEKLREYLEEKNNKIYVYIDEQIKETQDKINKFNDKIDNVVIELDNKINNVKAQLDKDIHELTNIVYKLNDTVYIYIQDEIKKLYEYIETYYCNNIKVYNPVNGKYETIENVLVSMYNALRYLGITCNEFDELGINCNAFESHMMSSSEFDMCSKAILSRLKILYMFNPLNGEYVYYQDVIYKLAELHAHNPISAQEFDILELTVELFESKDITTYNFDDNAKTLLKI